MLVDEPTGWRAYFCTDTSATVADILTTVADRFSLEIIFRECKQIVGAGQQQVRFLWGERAGGIGAIATDSPSFSRRLHPLVRDGLRQPRLSRGDQRLPDLGLGRGRPRAATRTSPFVRLVA